MKNEPVVIERTLNAPVAKVWKAITDKLEMKIWYFDIAEFKPVAGFEFQFTATGKDGQKKFVHLCKVTEVVAERKLSYTWRFEGYDGYSVVTFELFPKGDQTLLKLTHEGLESFPQDDDFAKQNFVEGWTHVIGTSLKGYLEKEPAK